MKIDKTKADIGNFRLIQNTNNLSEKNYFLLLENLANASDPIKPMDARANELGSGITQNSRPDPCAILDCGAPPIPVRKSREYFPCWVALNSQTPKALLFNPETPSS